MESLLSSLLNNFSKGIHKNECKYGHNNKKCETCRFKYKYWDCFLEYANFQVDLIVEFQVDFQVDLISNIYIVTKIIKKSLAER